MYYDDEDDDPYAPRIGPAAMPSPRSKFAPYFSGCTDTLEDFLEEYEGLAYGRALTDPQRVDVIIRYVAPSLRDFWRSLDGFRSRDWPRFRQSLVNIFGNPTPRHQIMRQKLRSYIQDSARKRMYCEDDVLQYYRQFICFGLPLVHAGHLSEEERDAAFWYGFHHEDRHVLWPRLLSKNPFQPSNVPFRFEDVFGCARAAFAYEDSSFWSHVKQFESPSVRREQPVVEPAPRGAHSFRAVTCAVGRPASNTETTTIPDELPPSSQSHVIQLPSSSSPSASESQQTLAHSVTLDQPEPAPTLPTTLRPSASFSTPSHTPTLVYSATDSDPIPASTPPSFSLIPPAFPTPTHTDSLARSDVEISSLHPLSSIMPASTMPPISSDFDYLPSATVDQSAPTLTSTPASSSSVSSTFLPSPVSIRSEMNSQPEPEPALASERLIPPSTDDPEITSMPHSSSLVELTKFECLSPATEDQSKPEPTPTLFASVPTLTSTPSHVHSAADNGTIFASTPPSLSPTSSTFVPFPVRSAMNNQPKSEHEAASTVPLLSLPLSTLHPLSPLSSTSLPSPVTSATDDQPEPESMSVSVISTKLELSPRALPFPPDLMLVLPISSPTLPSLPLPEISTLDSTLAAPSPDQPSSLPGSLSQLPCELESSIPGSAVDIAMLSYSESSLSSQGESIPFTPASLEAPPNATISSRSTLSQRPPGLKTVGTDSSLLEVTPPLASSVPQQSQDLSLVYEASSPRPSLLPLRPLSGPSSVHLNFAFALVSTAFLVSTLLNISKTLSTFARKLWSKNQDFGNNRNGIPEARNIPAQRLRLGQFTPRAPRLVFDPGGSAFAPISAPEDVRKRKSKTCGSLISLHHTRHQPSHSCSNSRRSRRFRPRRWSVRVRTGTRRLGDA
ncbi:hypothetical protein EDB89DRAFT_557480 [Lactarius sanguifluus]|nr:hypothetical protein EDB89DRAFT_557480 [Lactarius sanguifluus]